MIDFLAMDFLKHRSKLAKYFLGAFVLYRIVSYIEGERFSEVSSKKLSPPQRIVRQLRPCLQAARVTLVLGLHYQEGYSGTRTFLVIFNDAFTRQLGLPQR